MNMHPDIQKSIELYRQRIAEQQVFDSLGYRVLVPSDDDLDDIEDMGEIPWFLTEQAG